MENSYLPLTNPQGSCLNVSVPTIAAVTEVCGTGATAHH